VDGVAPRDPGWATWPNVVTAVRLAIIPVYVLLVIWTNHWAAAAWILAALGATDWVDGFLARRLHQVSELGKILDPVADRFLVTAGVVTIAVVGAVPWWFAALTLAREVLVSGTTLLLAALGAARIDVLWWGKVSTFALMTAYPMFLLTANPLHSGRAEWQSVIRDVNWFVGLFGLTLAWLVLTGYVKPALAALRTGRAARAQVD
jgi:cardiolipin synthase (CMP-forming)